MFGLWIFTKKIKETFFLMLQGSDFVILTLTGLLIYVIELVNQIKTVLSRKFWGWEKPCSLRKIYSLLALKLSNSVSS